MSGVKIYDGEKFVNFNISNGIELPVGFEYYVSYSELDSGQLIRDGQIVRRSVYKDLWDFVQKHPSLLLTEKQWQAELSANEGVVNNYYSSGDGSTTFRLPKAEVIESLAVVQAFGNVINTGNLDLVDIADQLLNMVTIDTTQTITGVKSFNKTVNFNYYTNFNYAFTVDVAAKFNNQIRIKMDNLLFGWIQTTLL